MKFELQIECDNDSFKPEASKELSRILLDLAYRCHNEGIHFVYTPAGHSIQDVNGNTVGYAIFSE